MNVKEMKTIQELDCELKYFGIHIIENFYEESYIYNVRK